MKHLGDITKIDWATVEPVDVVTGGSPCQDLSAAGKRKGLAGERSGLFMEQIRCVKELRAADVHRGRTGIAIRPRYMVWENVPGAFSSNKGQDFRAVLEETIRVICPDCPDVPVLEKGGWSKAGCLYDDMGHWSVAWRVHDAQFWGVPQRRKRISLVADFGGLSAPEILFERKGLSGDFEPGGTAREETSGTVGSGADNAEPTPINTMIATRDKALGRGTGFGVGEPGESAYTISAAHAHAVFCLNDQGGSVMDVSENVTATLRAQDHGHPPTVMAFKQGQGPKAGGIEAQEECSPTLSAVASGTNRVPAVYDARGNGDGQTVCTITGDHENRVTDYTALCAGNGQLNQISMTEQANTLDTMHDQQAIMVAAVDCRNGLENPDINGTLQAKESGGQSLNLQNVCRQGAVVRRLTPLECERLQGYPDGWTDIGEWVDSKGKKHKEADSPRYKALGNSIALPFWSWLMKRISAQYARDATLGSLFDGIGGFPYCWERVNGKGSARWASEIEEFPIAVTKIRFPERRESNGG